MAKNKLKSGAHASEIDDHTTAAEMQPTAPDLETAAEVAENQAAAEGSSTEPLARIGPDQVPPVSAPEGLQREFDKLQQSREEAENSVRLAARRKATGDEFTDQDHKDLAVYLKTANWTPQMYAVEVENQKARAIMRDAIRELPATQKQEAKARESLTALEAEREVLLAEINAQIDEAKVEVIAAEAKVREATNAKKRLKATATPKVRTQYTGANVALGQAEEKLRDAERKANNLADEVATLQRRIDSLAPETAEAEALREEMANKKLSAKTAGAAITDARRAVESAAETLADVDELLLLS